MADNNNQIEQNNSQISRRRFLGSIGVGTAVLSSLSTLAVANSSITDNPPVEETRVLDNIMVEMRDGIELATDIYLPDPPGQSEKAMDPLPTLVSRTPYNKEFSGAQAEVFAKHNYAVVVQDVRGKFASEGEYTPAVNEGEDGYDTIEWAANQEWSNGNVGMYGISYLGGAQWQLVQTDEGLPPDLESIAPGYARSSYYVDTAYPGGLFNLGTLLPWSMGQGLDLEESEENELTPLERAQEALQQLYWDLPVDPFEPLVESGYHALQDLFANETYSDEFWGIQDYTAHYDTIDIPVLNYGGWYDIYADATPKHFQGLREDGQPRAQEEATLVMGPYTHGGEDQLAQGLATGSPYMFPENSTLDEMALLLSWFDRTLKGNSETSELPRVRIYVPGLDEWIGSQYFPLPETEWTKYYLHSEGNANIADITDTNYEYEGTLSTAQPGDEPSDTYTYDPSDPVVTVGGYPLYWRSGIADRSQAYQDRDDILVYQTEVLDEDVAVIGPITATLYASTSAVDTDFVVTLSDVDPTGGTGGYLVAEGARRGRIGDISADPRDNMTYTETNTLEPGEVYEWKIAVWSTARVFEAGHRIRIDITSSDFPRYNRNLNTGEGLTEDEIVEAEQTIWHDEEHPSHVELPIVPVDGLEGQVIEGPVPERK